MIPKPQSSRICLFCSIIDHTIYHGAWCLVPTQYVFIKWIKYIFNKIISNISALCGANNRSTCMTSKERHYRKVVGWLGESDGRELGLDWVERNREGISYKGDNVSEGESLGKIFTQQLNIFYNIKGARHCAWRNKQEGAVGTVER